MITAVPRSAGTPSHGIIGVEAEDHPMPKPFDATTKSLIELRPADWLAYLGLPDAAVEVIDADLSTVTASADKVLRVRETPPWLLNLEPQAGYERDLGERLLEYSVLLRRRHHLGVRTIVLLLRPAVDGPRVTGREDHFLPEGHQYLWFEYGVVRAWQIPVGDMLAGGLGTLPLAPLADVPQAELPGVIRQMETRISAEAAPETAGVLWTATYVPMGLRYSGAVAERLLEGVRQMKESVTYQKIVEEGRVEGRVEEARALLLRLGRKRFGPPSPAAEAALAGITAIERLEALSERLLDAESWEELLATDE